MARLNVYAQKRLTSIAAFTPYIELLSRNLQLDQSLRRNSKSFCLKMANKLVCWFLFYRNTKKNKDSSQNSFILLGPGASITSL